VNKVLILVIIVVIVAVGGYFFMKKQSTAPATDETADETMEVSQEMIQTTPIDTMEKVVELLEQNDSSESGTATLTETDGKVTVSLNMTGGKAGVAQPAHIHVGSCPDVGAVEYPLTNVVDGKSETVLDVSLADLAAKQPLGINVHKSAAEVKVYVACGDLDLPMTNGSAMPATSAAPAASGAAMMKY
jgi:hypothetical protein